MLSRLAARERDRWGFADAVNIGARHQIARVVEELDPALTQSGDNWSESDLDVAGGRTRQVRAGGDNRRTGAPCLGRTGGTVQGEI